MVVIIALFLSNQQTLLERTTLPSRIRLLMQVQKLSILVKASFVSDKEKHTSTIMVTKMIW